MNVLFQTQIDCANTRLWFTVTLLLALSLSKQNLGCIWYSSVFKCRSCTSDYQAQSCQHCRVISCFARIFNIGCMSKQTLRWRYDTRVRCTPMPDTCHKKAILHHATPSSNYAELTKGKCHPRLSWIGWLRASVDNSNSQENSIRSASARGPLTNIN